ncbi:MAG: IclR family transcriptional regulator C-terminal domain-containing protein [Acidimicrobiales bacterium]|nr:IclR family transcriptional regulator C-terminal domain-containing protein [Acidimicrobiales bacterium]
MTQAVLASRTAALLRLVASNPAPLGLSEIARDSTIPKATCIRILRALVEEELLEIDPETRRYRVSFALTALMADRVQADGSIELLRHELDRLRASTHETAGIDLLIGDDVVVVLQVEGPQLISQTGKPVPRRLPLLRSSTGKAFLTWHHDPSIAEAALAPLSPTERARVAEEQDTNRQRGYAVAFEELDPAAAAIAAPVIVHDTMVCTVWIGGPSFRMTPEELPDLATHVVESANRLAVLLRTGQVSLDDLPSAPMKEVS